MAESSNSTRGSDNSTKKVTTQIADEDTIAFSSSNPASDDTAVNGDPYSLRSRKKEDISSRAIHEGHPTGKSKKVKKIKKYYSRQNALIDAYLGSNDEEAAEIEDTKQYGGQVKFAINASFTVNFCLFIIQMYAAISTGSLSLFATAADAFVSQHATCHIWLLINGGIDGPC